MKISKETIELCKIKNIAEFNSKSELQTYLRNEKRLHVDIYLGSKTFKWEINNWIIDLKHEKKIKWTLPTRLYNTYEDALEVCLQEMLKLLPNTTL